MSLPYSTIERLINKYGVADVLLMVSDVIEEKVAYMGFDKRHRADKYIQAGNVVRMAVKDLPKVPGIK